MRSTHLFLILIGVLILQPNAQAQQFVGVSWDGFVYHIDPATGTALLVGDTGFGGSNAMGIESTGRLIATRSAINWTDYYSVNPLTGLFNFITRFDEMPMGTVRGLAFDSADRVFTRNEMGSGIPDKIWRTSSLDLRDHVLITDLANGIQALTFAPDGTLFGWDTTQAGLVTIDTATGIVTNVNGLDEGNTANIIQTLAFDSAGNLYGARDELYLVDMITGGLTLIGSMGPIDIRGMAFVTGICDFFPGVSNDCNLNGIPDECDIIQGVEFDCNGNFIPDACDLADGLLTDCDVSGVPDSCEIASGAATDCNLNGIPDTCDLNDGTSTDFNDNGTPDECEEDCNANGLPDFIEILLEFSPDCNGNFVPDDCDLAGGFSLDCNTNGIPDECDDQSLMLPSDGGSSDKFGFDVDISGGVLIAGAYRHDHDLSGVPSAYIYRFDASSKAWIEEAELTPLDAVGFSGFGVSVAIDGDIALAAGDSGSLNALAVYVFRRDSMTGLWNEEAVLPIEDISSVFWVWRWLAIDGNVFIAGNAGNNPSPAAFIYRYDGVSWQLEHMIENNSPGFGIGADISGDVVVVGAWQTDEVGRSSGSAFVYRRNGVNWVEEAKLMASDAGDGDNFGTSVAIDNDHILIGAPNDGDLGEESGSVYVFRHDGVSWSQTAKLLASDGKAFDSFGQSIDLEGNLAIIGAAGDDDVAEDAGAAYLFRFDGVSWIEERKLLPHTASMDNWFGSAVAISGPLVTIGAPGDSFNPESGMAYVFTIGLDIDCDGNGQLDICDIADGILPDINNNGIPDECEAIIPGDTNFDGIVNVTDLLALLSLWGPCPAPCTADFNADGNVNVSDLLTLLANWG